MPDWLLHSPAPKIVVAVDGPAASGKGTLAKQIAATFNLAHLDTGLLYRSIGVRALQHGVDLGDEERLEGLCKTLSPSDLQVQSPSEN